MLTWVWLTHSFTENVRNHVGTAKKLEITSTYRNVCPYCTVSCLEVDDTTLLNIGGQNQHIDQTEEGLYAMNVKGTSGEEQACGMVRRACEEIIVFESYSKTRDQGWGTCCSPQHHAGSSIHLQTAWIWPCRAWSAAHKTREILSRLHPLQNQAFWTSSVVLQRRKWHLGLREA